MVWGFLNFSLSGRAVPVDSWLDWEVFWFSDFKISWSRVWCFLTSRFKVSSNWKCLDVYPIERHSTSKGLKFKVSRNQRVSNSKFRQFKVTQKCLEFKVSQTQSFTHVSNSKLLEFKSWIQFLKIKFGDWRLKVKFLKSQGPRIQSFFKVSWREYKRLELKVKRFEFCFLHSKSWIQSFPISKFSNSQWLEFKGSWTTWNSCQLCLKTNSKVGKVAQRLHKTGSLEKYVNSCWIGRLITFLHPPITEKVEIVDPEFEIVMTFSAWFPPNFVMPISEMCMKVTSLVQKHFLRCPHPRGLHVTCLNHGKTVSRGGRRCT